MTHGHAPLSADDFDVLQPPPASPSRGRYDAFISYSHESDTDIAPRIQQALERIAKPLLKRRALAVFRDATGLGAGGELWPKICRAMDSSEWLVLLCSVRAATVTPGKPDWVGREIRRWLATKGSERIILVLTDAPLPKAADGIEADASRRGGLVWDERRKDFDPDASPSLHPALFGVFDHQPLWADLSEARDDRSMTYQHRGFTEMLGQAIGGLHGKDPNEVFGEDLRIHKRNRRLVVTSIAALSALLATSIGAGAVAVANEREATRQRATAESRALAAQSLAWTGPRALLLAAEAYDAGPTVEAMSALLAAVDDPATAPDSDNRSLAASFTHQGAAVATTASADGARVATLDEDGWLSIWDARPRAARTMVAAAGQRIAFAGDDHVAVATDSTLTWVDAATGATGDPLDVGDRVTALASAPTGVLVGTGGGAVALVAPDSRSVDLRVDEHVAAVSLARHTAAGVVTADGAGRIVTRDATTLAPHTVATAAATDFTAVTADGSRIAALTASASGGTGQDLAAVFDVRDGTRLGTLTTADVAEPVDAAFTGVSDEIVVLARSAFVPDDAAALYRGSPDGEPVPRETARGDDLIESSVAFPVRPTAFMHGLPEGMVGVVGTHAAALSDLVDRTTESDGVLAQPTAPLSVSPATGEMLTLSQSGLAVADLTEPDAPLVDLGIPTGNGWLSPSGDHVLAVFSDVGAVVSAAPGGRGWLVPEPELSVVPAASLDGSRLAFAAAGALYARAILVVDTTTGAIVATVASGDPLCIDVTCGAAWQMSHLALSPDGEWLAVRTAAVAASSAEFLQRPESEPYVVLYDLTSGPTTAGDFAADVSADAVGQWGPFGPGSGVEGEPDITGPEAERPSFEWSAAQGGVRTGVEVARYAASATSVPSFRADGVLRFHDGRGSVLAVDPAAPAAASVTANQADGHWVLDENGDPVVAAGCTIVALGADAQPVNSVPRDEGDCAAREVVWVSATRTLVLLDDMGEVRLLPLEGGALRELACTLAGCNLTETEWRQFLGDEAYRPTCPGVPLPGTRPPVGAVPSPTPTVIAEDDAVFSLGSIVVQEGLPDPPHAISELTSFPGREELLSFLRDYFGADLGTERAEAQACFLPPVAPPEPERPPAPEPPPGATPAPEPDPPAAEEPWERGRCVGLLHVDASSIVAADFVDGLPLDWLLLEPSDDGWELAATYRREDNPVPPAWVTALLR